MASVDRRPNGKWRARWREYPGGPQKAKHFTRKIDAERHLVEVQHLLMSGRYVTPEAGRMTFDAFADLYLARQPWRWGTAQVASFSLAHARRKFGSRPLSTLRKGDVQAFITGLKLAPSTVAVVFQHLNAVLQAAVEDRLIVTNPAKGVKLPERQAGEVVPPTVAQVEAIYDAAAEWFRPAIVIGAGLGLRQGEVSGLTADRIDWLGRAVRVDRQLVTRWTDKVKASDFAPPKTRAAIRTIPASSFVLAELGEHVGRRHEGFVLHREGEAVDFNAFNYQWRKATAAVGLGGLRYHALRHGFASMLIAAGCSVKAVQRALGHSSAATTLNLYAHLWPGDEDRIRQAVDGTFGAGAEDRLRTARDAT
jgi:integrase